LQINHNRGSTTAIYQGTKQWCPAQINTGGHQNETELSNPRVQVQGWLLNDKRGKKRLKKNLNSKMFLRYFESKATGGEKFVNLNKTHFLLNPRHAREFWQH